MSHARANTDKDATGITKSAAVPDAITGSDPYASILATILDEKVKQQNLPPMSPQSQVLAIRAFCNAPYEASITAGKENVKYAPPTSTKVEPPNYEQHGQPLKQTPKTTERDTPFTFLTPTAKAAKAKTAADEAVNSPTTAHPNSPQTKVSPSSGLFDELKNAIIEKTTHSVAKPQTTKTAKHAPGSATPKKKRMANPTYASKRKAQMSEGDSDSHSKDKKKAKFGHDGTAEAASSKKAGKKGDDDESGGFDILAALESYEF